MGAAGHSPEYGSEMESRVLGPVEVLESGRRLDLGGPKQRTVLALLIANAGRPLTTDRLIEGAYGDDAPDAARRSVQTYVSNLRSAVGDMIAPVASGSEHAGLVPLGQSGGIAATLAPRILNAAPQAQHQTP